MSARLRLLYYVEWEDVRRDNKYTDDNGGLIYGIEWMNPDNREEVADVQWFATEEERWEASNICFICGSKGHMTGDHDWPKTKTVEELLRYGWMGWDEYYIYSLRNDQWFLPPESPWYGE